MVFTTSLNRSQGCTKGKALMMLSVTHVKRDESTHKKKDRQKQRSQFMLNLMVALSQHKVMQLF